MRIYLRAAFLELPAGTLYCSGKPWSFGGIHVKGETQPNGDFLYLCLEWISSQGSCESFSRLEEMLEKHTSYPMDEDYGRDGCFDPEELFLVYESADLLSLERHIGYAAVLAVRP